MDHIIKEIITEYKVSLDALDYTVKGRILKEIKDGGEYYWEVSHYCKPSETAGGAYIPSLTHAPTFEQAKNLMFAYLNSFTNIGVIPNKMF